MNVATRPISLDLDQCAWLADQDSSVYSSH